MSVKTYALSYWIETSLLKIRRNTSGPSLLPWQWQSSGSWRNERNKGPTSKLTALPPEAATSQFGKMQKLLQKLEQYGFGRRPLTEFDFYDICRLEDIEIIWSDEKFAFYFTLCGEHFIVLPKRKRGLRMLFAMFHELGHYAMHVGDRPDAAFLAGHGKHEAEADAVALIALMPKGQLRELAWLDGSRYGSHLYNERLRLFFLYNI
jgi:hypothetical protein